MNNPMKALLDQRKAKADEASARDAMQDAKAEALRARITSALPSLRVDMQTVVNELNQTLQEANEPARFSYETATVTNSSNLYLADLNIETKDKPHRLAGGELRVMAGSGNIILKYTFKGTTIGDEMNVIGFNKEDFARLLTNYYAAVTET
jgi:hypothetical protein